jgi:hypothetical protein
MFQVLNLIPKEGEGESFVDALARVRRCLGGGGATDNADSDSDLEVVTESVTVNLRCPVSYLLHIFFFVMMLIYFKKGFITSLMLTFSFGLIIYVSTICPFQFFFLGSCNQLCSQNAFLCSAS